jgi:pimeloyl-ACP methyl ester carboxylesterase
MSLQGKKVEINGVNYHVSDQGEGDKVVLLLHGMPDTSSLWKYLVPQLLKAGFRVVAPDMLGYGETDKPQEAERYNGELIIGDVIALIETLGLEKMDVVGHDWGAFVSWELVTHLPDLFRRHVAISVGHLGVFFGDLSIQSLKDNWYMYLNSLNESPDLYLFNDCEFLRKFIMPTHPEIDEVCGRLTDPAAMRAMLNWDRGNQLAAFFLAYLSGQVEITKCKVPTLGIWSAGDGYLPEEPMIKTADFMEAEWHYERLEEGSHWVMLDQADRVNRLILDWLTDG